MDKENDLKTDFLLNGSMQHLFLGMVDPNGRYPSGLLVHALTVGDKPVLYSPQRFCKGLVTLEDDHAVGRCECSICKSQMDIFDKYCSTCGAQSTGYTIINEK